MSFFLNIKKNLRKKYHPEINLTFICIFHLLPPKCPPPVDCLGNEPPLPIDGADGLDGSDGSDGPGTPSTLSTSFNLSTAEAKAVPLPPRCPTLRVSIPEDALAFDNEAVLPTVVPPPVPVAFDLADPALLSLARRAVEATGLADLAGTEPGHQDGEEEWAGHAPRSSRMERMGKAGS